MFKSYSNLRKLHTFNERFEYLKLSGSVGDTTFGFDRYLNQILYRSRISAKTGDEVIIRDKGCDLGVVGFEIRDKIIVHHINVVTVEDIRLKNEILFDPENLICVSSTTHLAIHYSDRSLLRKNPVERRPGDTRLWT